jgi:hypothetical protein
MRQIGPVFDPLSRLCISAWHGHYGSPTSSLVTGGDRQHSPNGVIGAILRDREILQHNLALKQ